MHEEYAAPSGETPKPQFQRPLVHSYSSDRPLLCFRLLLSLRYESNTTCWGVYKILGRVGGGCRIILPMHLRSMAFKNMCDYYWGGSIYARTIREGGCPGLGPHVCLCIGRAGLWGISHNVCCIQPSITAHCGR